MVLLLQTLLVFIVLHMVSLIVRNTFLVVVTFVQFVQWDALVIENNVNQSVTNVTRTILQIALSNVPNKTITIRTKDCPWITNDIKRTIRKKNRHHTRAKRSKSVLDWKRFRHIRNESTSKIRNAKIIYFDKLSKKLHDDSTSTKDWWKKVNAELVYDNKIKCELFNNFFVAQTELDDANVDLPNILSESEYVLNNINITESDVDLLNIVDISKAIGPDGISLCILKSILKYPLCKIFNISLRSGVFPSDWKKANLCPVFIKRQPRIVTKLSSDIAD